MKRRTELLLSKRSKSLSEQLQDAVLSRSVKSTYIPHPKKQRTESVEKYTERLASYASLPQFVQVAFNGQVHYVSFGVPGPLVTNSGIFTMIPAQVVGGRWGVHYLLFHPSFESILAQKRVFLRLDSGCTSGQLFGDITCDCKEQFDIALRTCAERGGVIVNTPEHDGRGWGEYKMANQLLMHEFGLDTVSAAKIFYGDEDIVDQRTYSEAILILMALGFNQRHEFELGTNNPRKVGAFGSFGMKVSHVRSVVAKNMNSHLVKNLSAKKKKWGHILGDINLGDIHK